MPPKDMQRLFEEAGQGHVFRLFPHLDASQQQHLIESAKAVDFEALGQQQHLLRSHQMQESLGVAASNGELTPGSMLQTPAIFASKGPATGEDSACETSRRIGEDLLREGQVALLMVAGGEGTRLGFPQPKGLFPVMPLSGSTLFATFAQQLRGIGLRYGVVPRWLVMTSRATDAATRRYFEAEAFFGLDAERIHFFCQAELPALDDEGRILLSPDHRIAFSPDGHGGCLSACARAGLLDQLEADGVGWVFYAQVDNVLAHLCDPLLLGLAAERGAEACLKAVRKEDPAEKVGVFGYRDGRATIVEYSELSESQAQQRLADGSLAWKAGNIAVHVFQRAFLQRVAAKGLPLHLARKVIPVLDTDGRPTQPTSPNGWKFERFIFDLLPLAAEVFAQEVERDAEFLPLKSAHGPTSPDAVAEQLQRIWRAQLMACGVDGATPLEMDAVFINDPNFLVQALGQGSVALLAHAGGTRVVWRVP